MKPLAVKEIRYEDSFELAKWINLKQITLHQYPFHHAEQEKFRYELWVKLKKLTDVTGEDKDKQRKE